MADVLRARELSRRILWLAEPTGVTAADRDLIASTARLARVLGAVPREIAEEIVEQVETQHARRADLRLADPDDVAGCVSPRMLVSILRGRRSVDSA